MPTDQTVDDGILQLHSADDDTVTWLRDMAVK